MTHLGTIEGFSGVTADYDDQTGVNSTMCAARPANKVCLKGTKVYINIHD